MKRSTRRAAITVLSAVSVLGVAAGCAADATEATGQQTSEATESAAEQSAAGEATDGATDAEADAGASPTDASGYADGEYSAAGSYQSPSGTESIDVTVTLADGVVTAVTVTPTADDPTAMQFQTAFAEGVAEVVVGQDIDSLSVDKVSGSSLTSAGFTAAIEQIKADAQA